MVRNRSFCEIPISGFLRSKKLKLKRWAWIRTNLGIEKNREEISAEMTLRLVKWGWQMIVIVLMMMISLFHKVKVLIIQSWNLQRTNSLRKSFRNEASVSYRGSGEIWIMESVMESGMIAYHVVILQYSMSKVSVSKYAFAKTGDCCRISW